MNAQTRSVSPTAILLNKAVSELLRGALDRRDAVLKRAHVGGRKANYDDAAYEFVGGAGESLRKKHYDKSLRLLWKAERHAPYLGFRDQTDEERKLEEMALSSLSDEEKALRARMGTDEFRAFLKETYTERERQAIVNILAAVGHGEAYAWLVSAELLGEVQSTGARAALTMQVLEEAKHFVVLRELLRSFDVPIRPLSAWEYMFLEAVLKAKGTEKLFGMNVLVEGIALSIFGLLGHLPGLEVLHLFHLDEARHTALPSNYFKHFPMSRWQNVRPGARVGRLKMILPALMLVPSLEDDMAVLGFDSFEFGGGLLRKVSRLATRSGFELPLPADVLLPLVNEVFNAYCAATRGDHARRDFTSAEPTVDASLRAVEEEAMAHAA